MIEIDTQQDTIVKNDLEDEQQEHIPNRYSITSYGIDYTVDSLVKRLGNEDILIPSFQRSFIWPYKQASRFIESLLLGLPVPGVFLSKEPDTKKMLVIDGQQRLRTLQYFYEGIFPTKPNKTEFSLKGVVERLEDKTYTTLSDEDRRTLDDSILRATIVKQDEPADNDSSIYHIFERLNTGGLQLQPQEIRACIYHGSFNNALTAMNANEAWRSVYGSPSSRMRDQELILRFLALYFNFQNYSSPMKEFLNNYMGKNRHLAQQSERQLRSAFIDAIELIHDSLGDKPFRPKKVLNAAIFDSVMVGVARRLERGPINDIQALKKKYEELVQNEDYIALTESGTARIDIIRRRLALATEAFSQIQ